MATIRGGVSILEQYSSVLKNCVLFQQIQNDEITQMLGCLEPRAVSYPKGAFISEAGGSIREIGVVLSGSVAVTKETSLGERVVLSKIPAGGIYGEIIALSENQTSPTTVFAADACTVLFILPQKILTPCRNVCPWHSTLTANLVRVVADKALFLNRKIDFLVIKSMRGKLCTYLNECCGKKGTTFTLSYNRNELADFLNVSRPSMSRELGRLRDEGILTFSGNTFRILDLSALSRYVE